MILFLDKHKTFAQFKYVLAFPGLEALSKLIKHCIFLCSEFCQELFTISDNRVTDASDLVLLELRIEGS